MTYRTSRRARGEQKHFYTVVEEGGGREGWQRGVAERGGRGGWQEEDDEDDSFVFG